MGRSIVWFFCLGVTGWATEASAVVLISGDYTDAFVSDGTAPSDAAYFDTGGTTAVATLPAGYSSTTDSSYATSGDSASFSATFFHLRQGDFFGQAYSQINVNFTSSLAAAYSAAGSYSNSAGYTNLNSYLFDGTTSTYLYFSSQESLGAAAAFNLGGGDGNVSNSFSGSLTGLLLPGHSYQWSATISTSAFPDPDSGAAADGGISLAISTVPEMESAMVWACVWIAAGGALWRQKARLARPV
jgi:hypothetical protein